jgi:DNA-binding IclR family transcriptional regulator
MDGSSCALSDEPEPSVTEVARRSGLHLATASRIIAQLVDHACSPGAPT